MGGWRLTALTFFVCVHVAGTVQPGQRESRSLAREMPRGAPFVAPWCEGAGRIRGGRRAALVSVPAVVALRGGFDHGNDGFPPSSTEKEEEWIAQNKETKKQTAARLEREDCVNFREEVKLNKILYDDGNETDSSEEEAQWEAASKGIYEHTMAKRRAKAAAFNRPAQDLIEPLIPDEHPDFKMVTEFPKTAEEMIDGLLSLGQAMQDPLEVALAEEERQLELRKLYDERIPQEGPTSIFNSKGQLGDYDVESLFVDKETGEPMDFTEEAIGCWELPQATREDFVKAAKENTPSADCVLDAWDMFKGKDPEACETVCLRHKRWGTEIELFIGSSGDFKIRADHRHQVMPVYQDGTWIDFLVGTQEFDADFMFDHLRANPGIGWVEAWGGADGYVWDGEEPKAPEGAVAVDTALLREPGGWTPAQDRTGDFDMFNTSYRRPVEKPGDHVWQTKRMPPEKGFWTAREERGRIVWRNMKSLCELHLTTEGAIFLGAEWEFNNSDPRAVRVEYGLGGCVRELSHLFHLPLVEARDLLGLERPEDVPAGGEAEEMRDAEPSELAVLLNRWTDVYGWHDLSTRLVERSRDFREAYRDLVREWRYENYVDALTEPTISGLNRNEEHATHFKLRGLKVEEVGHAPDDSNMPFEIRDRRTKEPLWRFGQDPVPEAPWASQLQIHTEGGFTQVFDRGTGGLLARFASFVSP
ncbi:hypothetical protein T484DRAFT_1937098 [Baffinella frigidus]|nr:hypothetical protein T484DRAFT_1937098 [Cryptophyta sp. CCMP2293]